MEVSNTSTMLSGIILITVPTIEYGGSFLLGMLRRGETRYVDNAYGTTRSARGTRTLA
jgi:hypothetical protein